MATKDSNTSVESYPMKGGDGPLSYAKNSSLQKLVVDSTKNLITEVMVDQFNIKNPMFQSCTKFQIVDLGCSVGPNTFIAVANIIEAVELVYKSNKQNTSTPEFQVYFNDHVNNDFNTLLKNLHPQPLQYFAAAVPGSFYDRLFPKSTIHCVHSSSALHWLTRVPKEVVDKNSPAWNKGRIYCSGTEQKVAEAYAAQFEKDMNTFLNVRAEEVVEGGLMLIQLGGTRDGVSQSQYLLSKMYDILGSCLMDMTKKGLIGEEKLDSFNLPRYFPSNKEIEKIILKNGNFGIERSEVLTYSRFQMLSDTKVWAQHGRAGLEGILSDHFGNEIMDELFECFADKLMEQRCNLLEDANNDAFALFLALKRNSI